MYEVIAVDGSMKANLQLSADIQKFIIFRRMAAELGGRLFRVYANEC